MLRWRIVLMIDAVTAEVADLKPRENLLLCLLRLRAKLRPPLLSRFANVGSRCGGQHALLHSRHFSAVESPKAFAAARIPVS